MSHWSDTLENMINDSLSGKLERIDKDLTTRLQPFAIENKEKLIKDWRQISEYEQMTDRYVQEQSYLMGKKLDEKIMKAIEQVNSIDKKLQIKKRFAYTQLAEGVLEAQQKAQASMEVKSIQKEWERLDRIQEIAQSLDQPRIEVMAIKAKEACDLHVEEINSKHTAKQGEATAYEKFVTEATEALHEKQSLSTLKEMRERMEGFKEYASADSSRNAQLEGFITKYDEIIGNRSQDNSRRTKKAFGWLAKAGLAIGIGYLGYVGVRAGADSIQEHRERRKAEKTASVEAQKAQEEAAQYEALATQRKEELQLADDELYRRQEELRLTQQQLSEIQTQQNAYQEGTQQATAQASASAKTYQSMLAERLSPVLGSAAYTLYIEKSSNRSVLLDRYGNILHTAKHTDAKNPGRKTAEGQNRTPEGKYLIDRQYFNDSQHDPLYGIGFYGIDYPNASDQAAGFTGSGVLLCSAASPKIEDAIINGRDVMVCGVAYLEDDFRVLRNFIGSSGGIQVVIEDYQQRPLSGLKRVE